MIVRSLFDAERVAGLLELSEQCLKKWKQCNPETGHPGAAQPDRATSMRHLNHPDYFDGGAKSPQFKLLMEAVADPEVLRIAGLCLPDDDLCGGPLFRSTTLFFNPEGGSENSSDGAW